MNKYTQVIKKLQVFMAHIYSLPQTIFTAAKQSGHTCTCIAENIWPVKDHCIHTIKSVVGISMVFTIRTVQAMTLTKQPRCYTTQEKYM